MLVDLHGKIKALFFFPFHLFYGMTNGIFVSLFNFVSLFMLTASYLYKTLKIPAHWCIYTFCVLYSFNEIFILHFRI